MWKRRPQPTLYFLLVLRMQEGEEQTDCNRLYAAAAHFFDQLVNIGIIKLLQNCAFRIDPAVNLEAQMSWGDRRRLVNLDPVDKVCGATESSHFDDVAKSLIGNQRGHRTFALYNSVCGDGGAMSNERELGW